MSNTKQTFRSMLLGGFSIYACCALPAFGQSKSATDTTAVVTSAGQQTGAQENITVTSKPHQSPGGGLMAQSRAVKAVQTSSREYIQTQPATTNPIRVLALQPGAVVSQPDPFGIQPGSITVRGLNNNEIGWIFEGAPLNDGQLYPNEVVDAPNLEQVSLVPGSSDFDTPSSGAAAGVVQILLHDPQHTRGGQISLGYGSYHTQNEFMRLDSGDIGNSGIRGFFSYSNVDGNDWRSPGNSARTHIDSKFIKDWGGGSQTALAVSFNAINFQVERAPTLAQWNQFGTKFNYDGTFAKGDTNYYNLHQNPYKNVYATLPSTVVVSPRLTLYSDVYMYAGTGVIPGGTVLSPSSAYVGTSKINGLNVFPNGNGTSPTNALLYSATVPTLDRVGVNSNARLKLDSHNELELGYWYEYNQRRNLGQFGLVSTSGVPESVWNASASTLRLPNGKPYSFTDNVVVAQTNDIYLGDRMRYLNDKLAIDFGLKNMIYQQKAYNRIPGATYNINNYQFEPMPSLGARYDFAPHQQIFFDAGVNTKMPDASQLLDSISATTGVKTTVAGNQQKPEVSIVEELGYRYTGSLLVGQVTLFNYNFTNRQISTIQIQNNAMVTAYINAGGQTSRGVDVSIGTRPFYHFRPFVSGEYLHATIDNDISRAGDLLPTAGKTATGAPHWTGNIGINYDNDHVFGMLQVHYASKQYSTFMNDESMPGFATVDATLGYRFHAFSFVKRPQLMLNLVNLGDHKYLTGINSTQFNAKTTRGVYGTSIAGASPTYLEGGGFAALGAFSFGF